MLLSTKNMKLMVKLMVISKIDLNGFAGSLNISFLNIP